MITMTLGVREHDGTVYYLHSSVPIFSHEPDDLTKFSYINSIRELLNTLSRGHKLLAEMFEKRKSLSYKYEYALEVLDNNEDIIQLLLSKDIIRQNGVYLELDDQFLQFFEQILEVNEEINTSYINENIRQVKDEYMLYYLQANSDSERYKYLKAVKSSLRKVGRITIRNILDLNRNIENTFKTEPNYKIKLLKLENHKLKLTAIQQLIEQTEKLITEDELTFFKTATDEELKLITIQLRLDFTESRQNLIETRKQIIETQHQSLRRNGKTGWPHIQTIPGFQQESEGIKV